MDLKVLKVDDEVFRGMNATRKQQYMDDPLNYASIPFKPKGDPNNGWAVPFVTDHKYKIHWRHGIDFT